MDKKSIESKKFRSPIGVKSDKRSKESALNMPSVQATKPNAPAAIYRLVLSDSTTQATPGSNNEIAELKAAMLNKTKKSFPKIKPKGIFTKAQGKVTKTKPGPAAASRLLAKTMGKIAIPANRATNVSKKATDSAVEPIFWLAGMYAP